ncbi:ABC transporter ATP-binding protein [Desulfitobacterium sp. THU1]|uniref:ABC transporter ATP-binding protein n=1 Tax=Desulfitobacterium sp. THU1 TaxID=3138072 RepID=UPI00311FB3D0
MSSDLAVSLKNVSKCYHIYDRPKDRLLQGLWRGNKQFYREFWALRGVSFDVRRGETIGIIGRNGSGKSTILQIIAGTLTPTDGSHATRGRVSALLELGSGFNPEFTGRENVIMSGAIMGLSKQEILQRMPLIEQFAEIGEFIDQPVKLYSSGMYVRLAFACAINVDPDILVIDEALAVGDLQFQLKCIEKMKSFKRAGKTIVFVSHDVYTVRNFCDTAIWMKDGKVHLYDDVNTVTERYLDYMQYTGTTKEEPRDVAVVKKSSILTIDNVMFLNENRNPQRDFYFAEPVTVQIDYTLHTPKEGIVGGVAIYDKQNTYVCGLNTKLDKQALPNQPGRYRLELSYQEMSLLPGTYFVDVGFFEDSAVIQLDYKSRVKSFRIFSGEYIGEGLTLLKHDWSCRS